MLKHMDQLRKKEMLKLSQLPYNQVASYLTKFKMNHVREQAVKAVKARALKLTDVPVFHGHRRRDRKHRQKNL